jgi:hypothetical protein
MSIGMKKAKELDADILLGTDPIATVWVLV